MRQHSNLAKYTAEKVVKDIRRATRKQYSAEEKIRIVLEGLRGEDSIAELCRKEGINQNLYYRWSKEFLEAGKKRLAGDTARAATSDEVKVLRKEARDLKEVVRRAGAGTADSQKKHDRGWGRRRMRYPASEKLEIIRLVEQSHLSARRTLEKLGIPRSTFNRWYDRFLTGGIDALEDCKPRASRVWNRIPDKMRDQIIELALNEPELSPRELAVTFIDTKGYFVSESSVYRLLKAHDLITSPAFTMKAEDVTDTLTLALRASGCDSAKVVQRPRLLSDNGPSYVSSDLAAWLSDKGMDHTRGAPCHPQTQGKIERWHQTLKNRILLENYFLPGDLERQVAAFVDHYNHRRYHESLSNLTPADIYFGRGDIIMLERERIKRKTIKQRRLLHREAVA